MKGKTPKFPLPKSPPSLIHLHKGGFDQLEAEESQRMQLHMDENSRNLLTRMNVFNDVLRAAIERDGIPANDSEMNHLVDRCNVLAEQVSTQQLMRKWESVKDLYDHMQPKVVPAHLIWSAAQVGVDICERLDASAAAPAEDIRPPSVILPG